MIFNKIIRDKLSISYLCLVGSLALHVIDEAINHFLDFYNPLVLKLKEHLIFFPFPTFGFKVWISGLILVIITLLLIAPFVYRRNKVILLVTRIFAILMVFNGFGHFAFSIYHTRALAGMLSSPILIFFSIFYIYQVQLNYKSI
jgi:hypothetical protein